MKIEGEFLPAFAGLIPFLTLTVLRALRVGALSQLASTWVQKLIENGLHLKEVVCVGQKLMEKGCILHRQAVKDLKL